jgi:general secretion pathway protein B
MITPRRTHKLRVFLPALAIVTALTVYAAVAEKHTGPAGTLRVAKAAQVVPGAPQAALPAPAPAAPVPAATGSVSGPRPMSPDAPPAVPARPRSARAASPVGGGEIGRPNPFATPGFAQPPRPARSGAMSFGLDLPLPPGAASLAVPAPPPPPPPGAGMTVGGIVGSGSERVAIIRVVGDIYVVGVGEQAGGADVVEIRDDKVVMRKGSQTFELPYGGGAP